jgi:hypothetical protein
MANEQVTLDKYSMFIRTPVYRVGEDIVFGLRREVVMPDVTDVVIEVTQAMDGRLDVLAFELYGTSDLWWVIAELNQITDPMTEVKQGVELRVPRSERLFNILST